MIAPIGRLYMKVTRSHASFECCFALFGTGTRRLQAQIEQDGHGNLLCWRIPCDVYLWKTSTNISKYRNRAGPFIAIIISALRDRDASDRDGNYDWGTISHPSGKEPCDFTLQWIDSSDCDRDVWCFQRRTKLRCGILSIRM